jgi:hypothetical protein
MIRGGLALRPNAAQPDPIFRVSLPFDFSGRFKLASSPVAITFCVLLFLAIEKPAAVVLTERVLMV